MAKAKLKKTKTLRVAPGNYVVDAATAAHLAKRIANPRKPNAALRALFKPARAKAKAKAAPNTTGLINEIAAVRDGIARGRDRLREIKDDLEGLLESADTAVDEIDAAVQTLSRYL